ncbi:MAG: ATP-binding protein [Rhodobacteraceae bacterium]|nr:ATP-binding protein [Paracoccaceae bacterium]
MASLNLLLFVSLAYVIFLFGIAAFAERRAERGKDGWLRSPLIYTLSLSVYCTAWTFYGAVGYAARSGLEFLTIYLGPTGVLIGWWLVLRKLVRIGQAERITSVADLISSRFGKSTALGVSVTLIAVIGTTPYIALQLQSVVLAISAFSETEVAGEQTALWVAAGLAIFTILFGTRNLDANERHHGVVIAIAVEAIVKLVALLAVGAFVVWGIAGGIGDIANRIEASPISNWEVSQGRWLGITFLSAAAFICLPRMFQVMVVENGDERHLATASWLFPAYLLLMSLFVVPIAVVGLELLPAGSNPDLFVLTLPLSQGQGGLAMLSFLGGFSSATGMVIVAAIALATMVSNNIVLPTWLRLQGDQASVTGDVRSLLILSRRLSISVVLFLGYVYYYLSGGGAALAAIGLISFVGVAQALPAMMGGIFWRGATRFGAGAGLAAGALIWAYSLFLPSFGAGAVFSQAMLETGPWGIGWLRPQALFGIAGIDPVVHAFLWSMLLNSAAFVFVSLLTFPTPLERLQGAQFVSIFDLGREAREWQPRQVESEDLLIMAQRILGSGEAQRLFQESAAEQGKPGLLPDPTPDFLADLERSLAGSVGGATAHAMVGQIVGRATVTVEELMAVADETAQMMEYSSQLEAKSDEQARLARQLRRANEKLTLLSVQKDAFLSQISHELRTPMTSIRAFSEILQEAELDKTDRQKYASVIYDETIRLTRLLDDLLDLSVLENGQVTLEVQTATIGAVIDRAIGSATLGKKLRIEKPRHRGSTVIETDVGRLSQVFINLIRNAEKYCDAEAPLLSIRIREAQGIATIDFIDNGSGIAAPEREVIFEKFSRLTDQQRAGGTGLGLAICREIMTNLKGSITYLPGQGGAAFRVTLPVSLALAAE